MLAARALEHAVLVVAELASCAATARPRAVGVPCSLEHARSARLDGARLAVVQRALAKNAVELDAEARAASRGCRSSISSTPRRAELVRGQRRRARDLLRRARPRSRPGSRPRAAPRRARAPGPTRRACDLRAGVVEVVLARARRGRAKREQPRERVAVGGVAARWPRAAGPVGLAETNSTMDPLGPAPRRRRRSRRPRRGRAPSAAAYQASARNEVQEARARRPRRARARAPSRALRAPRRAARRSRAAAPPAPAPAASPRSSSSRRSRPACGRSSVGAASGWPRRRAAAARRARCGGR